MSRPIHGVVLLDKPKDITSQTAVTLVKKVFQAQKAGHTGTLDPMATGLLPVCLGEATKYSQDLLEANKSYLATIQFGQATTTGDAEGEVVFTGEPSFNQTDTTVVQNHLQALLLPFTGVIKQVPPMYSALKKDGKPLYDYARSGIEVEREAREVEIYSLEWVDVRWPVAQLKVSCSKGTYIRTLAEDMGKQLGCGAHLIGLRRLAVGHLSIDGAFDLNSLQKAQSHDEQVKCLLPVDALLQTLHSVELSADDADRLLLGQRVPVVRVSKQDELLRVYRGTSQSENFLGTADWRHGVLHPKRLIAQSLV